MKSWLQKPKEFNRWHGSFSFFAIKLKKKWEMFMQLSEINVGGWVKIV